MSRRDRKGLRVAYGERYALLPREVAESQAYCSLPDWGRTVLVALLCQYNGANNGCLALPFSQAKSLGVSQQWKLYAGLKILEAADLIICTRRGHLAAGTKLPSLYGVTWRGLNDAREGMSYDAGVRACPIPTNAWCKWAKPEDWRARCREIARANHGRSPKNPESTALGKGRSTTLGATKQKTAQPVVDKEPLFSAQPVVDTSKILGGSPTVRARA